MKWQAHVSRAKLLDFLRCIPVWVKMMLQRGQDHANDQLRARFMMIGSGICLHHYRASYIHERLVSKSDRQSDICSQEPP